MDNMRQSLGDNTESKFLATILKYKCQICASDMKYSQTDWPLTFTD
jgi:hypothetical protein